MTVLGFCSAAMTEVDIRKDFRYKIKHGEEVYASTSQRRHVIKVGSMIRFLVKSMDEYMLHISGSLLPPNTGSIKWLDKEEGSESARRVKKRKGESHKGMQVQGIGLFDEEPLQNNEGSSMNAKRQ